MRHTGGEGHIQDIIVSLRKATPLKVPQEEQPHLSVPLRRPSQRAAVLLHVVGRDSDRPRGVVMDVDHIHGLSSIGAAAE